MSDVQTTGRGIAWRADGPATAPALLLLGSLGTTSDIWQPQLASFTPSLRVIRLDTRGHGASAGPAGEYTLDEIGADALSVLDAAGVERAAVCGVSLGGMTAMWLAAHAPERVRALIAVSTALKIGARATWEERIAQVRAGGTASLADGAMGRWFTEPYREAHADTVGWCRSMLAACPTDGYLGCCAVLRDSDLHPVARRIVAPTQVIVGREDPVTPPAAARDIADHISGARVLTLEASHICAVECPDEFNRAVLDFLAAPRASAQSGELGDDHG
ncbi:MAG: 3-oxoadipate enol-lactonase [Vicinamibacterales bacterium]